MKVQVKVQVQVQVKVGDERARVKRESKCSGEGRRSRK